MLTVASVISKGVWCSQTGEVDSVFATRCVTLYSHLLTRTILTAIFKVNPSWPVAVCLLVRRSGIPCRTTCVTRLLAGTVSDNL